MATVDGLQDNVIDNRKLWIAVDKEKVLKILEERGYSVRSFCTETGIMPRSSMGRYLDQGRMPFELGKAMTQELGSTLFAITPEPGMHHELPTCEEKGEEMDILKMMGEKEFSKKCKALEKGLGDTVPMMVSGMCGDLLTDLSIKELGLCSVDPDEKVEDIAEDLAFLCIAVEVLRQRYGIKKRKLKKEAKKFFKAFSKKM